jgi:hypothetical protein
LDDEDFDSVDDYDPDRFDRRRINRALQTLAAGSYQEALDEIHYSSADRIPGALPLNVPIQSVDRPCERVENVGLRLKEAKAVLQGLQEQLIRQQVAEYLEARRPFSPGSTSRCESSNSCRRHGDFAALRTTN